MLFVTEQTCPSAHSLGHRSGQSSSLPSEGWSQTRVAMMLCGRGGVEERLALMEGSEEASGKRCCLPEP